MTRAIAAIGGHRDQEAAHRDRRSEEHTSELQSLRHLVCRLLLEKKKKIYRYTGEEKYLDFCKQVVSEYDHPGEAATIQKITKIWSVYKTENNNDNEMHSNIYGFT